MSEYASARIAEVEAPSVDWLTWMPMRLQIMDMDGNMVSFQPNAAQLRLFATMERQRSAGLPVRIIILKSRKVGISTGIAARYFTETFNRPNRGAFVCAHDADSSDVLFRMVRIYNENLPDDERRPEDYSSKKEIVWSWPHYSSYRVQTAGKLELKRGDTLFYIHCSELAFYPNAGRTLTALLNALAKSADTMVVLESTANGVGGEFYERWNRAVARMKANADNLNGFVPIFIGWLDDPNNQMPVPKDYDWSSVPAEIMEDEPQLRALGASDEHIYFRRYKILEDMNGEIGRFKQEYPATPDEAFLLSGRPAIPTVIIKHHESLVKPGERCRLSFVNVPGRTNVLVSSDQGFQEHYWEVWERPQPEKDYCVFGDVAEGKLSDPNDTKGIADRHAGGVLDRTDMRLVAAFLSPWMEHGMPIDADLFGVELLKAAYFYNGAWASPEVNSEGLAALSAFRDYPRLYQRERPSDAVTVLPLAHYGWETTSGNRDLMIDDCIAACRPHPETGFEGKLAHHCKELVEEEWAFIRDKTGKRQHRPGKHDDLWMMLCGLVQLHLRCPRTRRMVIGREFKRNRPLSYAYTGGYDPGLGRLARRRRGLRTR